MNNIQRITELEQTVSKYQDELTELKYNYKVMKSLITKLNKKMAQTGLKTFVL